MKRLLLIALAMLLVPAAAFAQWQNEGAWPSDTLRGSTHGIAVDPDGKVWIGNYYAWPMEGAPTTRAIYVFNEDGSEADFSPITTVTVGDVTDTLNIPITGLRTDHEGNILVSLGAAESNRLFRLDYETGEGMNRRQLDFAGNMSLTAPAVTEDGDIVISGVFNGAPILLLNPDFTDLGVVDNEKAGFSRTIEISADGNRIYHPAYDQLAVHVYESEIGVFGDYELVDTTFLAGAAIESMAYHPTTGNLWFSGGSYNNLPDEESPYEPNVWYEYDFETESIGESFAWEFDVPEHANERPRAIAFTPDGLTAYVGTFGINDIPAMQRVVATGTSIEQGPEGVPTAFELKQNYPNPFNPSTRIEFAVKEAGEVALKVYDMLGREVATLQEGPMAPGNYTATFDASQLSSGTYIYVLEGAGQRVSKSMVLLK